MRAAFFAALSIVAAIAVVLSGCSDGDAPPFEELSLRDALRADPKTIAALPDPAKKTLADRFEQAGAIAAASSGGQTRVSVETGRASAEQLANLVDGEREAAHEDAWVQSIVRLEPSAATARPPRPRMRRRERRSPRSRRSRGPRRTRRPVMPRRARSADRRGSPFVRCSRRRRRRASYG